MALAQSLPMLILARMIDGLSGGNLAVAHAILADTSPREERSRVFGMVIGSAFGLGFIIGPLITIAILLTLGDAYGVVALVAACYSLIALGVAWKTLPETKASGTIPSAPALEMARIERPALIVLLLVCLGLQQFAFGGFERLLGLFNVTHLGIGAAGTGYIFIYIGLIVVWVQARGIRKFVSRLGERHLAVVGFLLLISGLVMISMTPAQPSPWFDRAALQQAISGNTSALALPTANTLQITLPSGNPGWSGFLWLLASLLPLATGGAILRPVINSLLSQNVPIERVGGVLGISSATISAANALAPLIGGVLFVKSPTLPFLVFSATATIGLAVLLVSILSMQKDVGRMSLSSPGR
jgi:MFS family permease